MVVNISIQNECRFLREQAVTVANRLQQFGHLLYETRAVYEVLQSESLKYPPIKKMVINACRALAFIRQSCEPQKAHKVRLNIHLNHLGL